MLVEVEDTDDDLLLRQSPADGPTDGPAAAGDDGRLTRQTAHDIAPRLERSRHN